jgi:hypothetical protein
MALKRVPTRKQGKSTFHPRKRGTGLYKRKKGFWREGRVKAERGFLFLIYIFSFW